jgi:hypothetical protein
VACPFTVRPSGSGDFIYFKNLSAQFFEGTIEKEMNKLYVNCFPLGQKRFVLALAN